MQILILNQSWFADELRAFGHVVVTAGMQSRFDIYLETPINSIEAVLRRCPEGFVPERILVLDNSGPIIITDLHRCDIPKLFYSIDVHHHLSYHRYFYHLLDRTLVAQKDYLTAISELGNTELRSAPKWMPLWASEQIQPSHEKKHGAVFVGSLNPRLNAERVAFFDALQKQCDLLVTTGKFQDIFPYSEVIVNQTVKGDLNFRVFEAMQSGAMLLTERTGNGLSELFSENKHLMLYDRGNVEEAAARIQSALANIPQTREIAAAGLQEVQARHLPVHRAAVIEQELKDTVSIASPITHYAATMNCYWLAQRLERLDHGFANRAHLQVLENCDQALKHGEPINQEILTAVLVSAAVCDRRLKSNLGARMTDQLIESYKELEILQLVKVGRLLEQGQTAAAHSLANHTSSRSAEETISRAMQLMGAIRLECSDEAPTVMES